MYLFNICTVQWLFGERVGILYMVYIYCVLVKYMYCTVAVWRKGWDLVHGVHILCTCLIYVSVQWISGERVGIMNMVYTYCVHCTCLMYVYCTVDIWRKGWYLIHCVHIFFTCLMYVLFSRYLEKGLGSCIWCTQLCTCLIYVLYIGYLEKGLGSCTWCAHILYMFNVCAVQWISVERVGILYMVYIYICTLQWIFGEWVGILCTYIVYISNICTVQWLSGERVGILCMVYIYCVLV